MTYDSLIHISMLLINAFIFLLLCNFIMHRELKLQNLMQKRAERKRENGSLSEVVGGESSHETDNIELHCNLSN
jgi:hypothetical protein